MGRGTELLGRLEADDGAGSDAIATWGLTRTYSIGQEKNGRPTWVKAAVQYRDFDGVTRQVQSSGKSVTQATQNLWTKLQNRTMTGGHGELTAVTRFANASKVWLARLDTMVADGRRSPGTVETYRRQLKNHILPAMGAVRLGGATTPLIDKVISSIDADVSSATARAW